MILSTLTVNLRLSDAIFLALLPVSVLFALHFRRSRSRATGTPLKGPPPPSRILGASRLLFTTPDSSALFEGWAKEYGPAFHLQGVFGRKRVVLTDPRGIAHFFARQGQSESSGYVNSSFGRKAIERLVGRGILSAEGDDHKRQRRTLSPAFSNTAIRELLPIFYDSAYRCKAAWDSLIAAGDCQSIIDVQKWMNAISLDTIGIAGFAHDFNSLSGLSKTPSATAASLSPVAAAFDALGSSSPSAGLAVLFSLLGPVLPVLLKIPTKRGKLVENLHSNMAKIAEDLLQRSRAEKEGQAGRERKSIIGALLKAESGMRLSEEEVLAQMKVLILAGYETTSISLTWALIELAQHPEKQARLRAELRAHAASGDPSYETLTTLPYLDAIFREGLRVHPPVRINSRVAAADDVIPLSEPITTATGECVDKIEVPRGMTVFVPLKMVNTSPTIWGPDAHEFRPERWLDSEGDDGSEMKEAGLPASARALGGYHHVLSFIDGPRICLGRLFAVAEFKAVLSVLVRNYVFEMRDGPDTKLDSITTVLPRPKVVGEEGYAMPMRVRRVD